MDIKPGPAFELVDALLDYNRDTGQLHWKDKPPRGRIAGDIAGTRSKDGYVRLHIHRQSYSAQRIAVLLVTGRYPLSQVHFKNEDRSDLRWSNLICDDSSYVRLRQSALVRGKRLRWDAREKKWAVFCSEGKCTGVYSSYADAAAVYNFETRSETTTVVNDFCSSAQYQWR